MELDARQGMESATRRPRLRSLLLRRASLVKARPADPLSTRSARVDCAVQEATSAEPERISAVLPTGVSQSGVSAARPRAEDVSM